jgi:hypothetical protein
MNGRAPAFFLKEKKRYTKMEVKGKYDPRARRDY